MVMGSHSGVRIPLPRHARTTSKLAHAPETGQKDRLGTLMNVKRDRDGDVSGLLQAWRSGDVEARDQLMTVVYQELRRRAAAHLRRERVGDTMQPTALVHEAYLRLVKQERASWQHRAQFFGVASQMMRRILVDRARARNMAKRSGRWARVTLDEEVAQSQSREVDVLDLDRALSELATFDARKSQVAELRFFGGLSLEETGQVVWSLRRHAGAGVAGNSRMALLPIEPESWPASVRLSLLRTSA